MVSLFPERTFKNRPNGLRADLAQAIADLQPKFMRFPGGCLVHGDGLGNMYRWKNTIGPVEQRIEQRNIWGYHQTAGLGYFEYFQFCEDMGAKPLPVVAAAVSCKTQAEHGVLEERDKREFHKPKCGVHSGSFGFNRMGKRPCNFHLGSKTRRSRTSKTI